MSSSATALQRCPTDGVLELGDEEMPLDDDERRALDAAITASLQQVASRDIAPAAHVLAHLRARRG